MQLAGFTRFRPVRNSVLREVPTQTVVVEPDKDVLERAERLYRENDPDMSREEYLEQWVVDSTRIDVDLES